MTNPHVSVEGVELKFQVVGPETQFIVFGVSSSNISYCSDPVSIISYHRNYMERRSYGPRSDAQFINFSLHISGVDIKHVEQYEYLGIVVDNKLSFKYHSSKCSRGANSKIYQLRKIRGSITTKCALSIYKTMILPLLEYGGVFLGSCTERERTKLQRLQNQALRTIYKKDNHTNLYSLHDNAKLLPLNLRREIALIKIIYNKVHNSHETQTKKLTTRAHDGPGQPRQHYEQIHLVIVYMYL